MSVLTKTPVPVKSEDVPNQDERVCCGCLATNDLFNFREEGLEKIFNEVTGIQVKEGYLCWLCLHLLRKCHAFRASCRQVVHMLHILQPILNSYTNEEYLNNTKKQIKHNYVKTKPVLASYEPCLSEEIVDTKYELTDEEHSYSDLNEPVLDNEENFKVVAMDFKTEDNSKTDSFINEMTDVDDNITLDNFIQKRKTFKNKINDKKHKLNKTKATRNNKKQKLNNMDTKVKKKCKKGKNVIKKTTSQDEIENNGNEIENNETEMENNGNEMENNGNEMEDYVNEMENNGNEMENNGNEMENETETSKQQEWTLIIHSSRIFRNMWHGKSNEYIFQLLESIHKESLRVKTGDGNCDEINRKDDEIMAIREFLDENKKVSDMYNVDVEFISLEEEREKMEEKRRSTTQEEGFCSLCCRKYKSADTYDRHMGRTHNETWQNVCVICQYRYKLKRDLVGHLLGNHARRFRCRECGIYVADEKWSLVREHAESHRGVVTTCNWCGKHFNAKKLYYMHLRAMHSMQIARAECLLCGDMFNGADGLRQHTKKTHTQAKQCERCETWFRDLETLNTHKLLHTHCDTGGYSYCGMCGDGFPSAELMRDHYNQQHNLRKCAQCKKSFDSVTKLKAHKCRLLKKRTDVVDRKRQEKDKSLVNEEKKLDPYRFVCEYCGKHFKQKIQLQLHQRTHTGERPYECDVCHKKFAQEYFLKVHQRKHTGQRFQCGVCKKTYAVENYLKIHQRVHTGARPYQCAYCPNTFRQSSHLRAHMPSHTKERAHVCGVCGKSFTQRSNMMEHARVIHEGEPSRSRRRKKQLV